MIIKKDKKYCFKLHNEKGETILTSVDYISLSLCKAGIDAIKINAQFDIRYVITKNENEKYYFKLVTPSGYSIGISKEYNTEKKLQKGILEFKKITLESNTTNIKIKNYEN